MLFLGLPYKIARIPRYESVKECVELAESIKFALDKGVSKDYLESFLKLKFVSFYSNLDNISSVDSKTLILFFNALANKEVDDNDLEDLKKLTNTAKITFKGEFKGINVEFSGEMLTYSLSKYLRLRKSGPVSFDDCLNYRQFPNLLSYFGKFDKEEQVKIIDFNYECDNTLLSKYLNDVREHLDEFTNNSFMKIVLSNISESDCEIEDTVDSFSFGGGLLDSLYIHEACQINKRIKLCTDEEFLRLINLKFRETLPNSDRVYPVFTGRNIYHIMKSYEDGFLTKGDFRRLTSTSKLKIASSDCSQIFFDGDIKDYDIGAYLYRKEKKIGSPYYADYSNVYFLPLPFKRIFTALGTKEVSLEFVYDSTNHRISNYLDNLKRAFTLYDFSLVSDMITDRDLLKFYKTTNV